MRYLIVLALGVGCVSEEDAAHEARVAAGVAADAIAAGLMMTETFGYIDPRGTRHGPSKFCPAVELTGTEFVYVMLLDYDEEGCEAESGWIPWQMGGHYWVDVGQDAVAWTRLEGASVEGLGVSGAPAGTWDVSDTGWDLDVSGPVGWGRTELDLDLSITFDGRDPSMTMSGSVEARQGTLTLDTVTMHRVDAQTRCPVPREGTFTWSGDLDLVLGVQGTRLSGEVGGHRIRPELCRQGELFSSGG